MNRYKIQGYWKNENFQVCEVHICSICLLYCTCACYWYNPKYYESGTFEIHIIACMFEIIRTLQQRGTCKKNQECLNNNSNYRERIFNSCKQNNILLTYNPTLRILEKHKRLFESVDWFLYFIDKIEYCHHYLD